MFNWNCISGHEVWCGFGLVPVFGVEVLQVAFQMAFLLVLTFKQSLQKTFIAQKENCITGWYILDTSLAVAKSGESVNVYLILSWCQASRYLAWEEKIKRILREQSYLKTTRETNVVGMTTWFWENMILSTK